jgi:protein-S-isoprenylcysteine O-methyltransferase Ste14
MQLLIRNIWILFLVSEIFLLIFRRSAPKASTKRKDRNSLLLLWTVVFASMGWGTWFANYHHWTFREELIGWTGVLVFFLGGLIRWLAILQLGSSFTVDVSIRQDQKLKTNGLYTRVRHPSYSGLMLMVCGIGFTTNSLLSFFIMVLPILGAFSYRMHIEEKALEEAFGKQYEEYRHHTKRIIPWMY